MDTIIERAVKILKDKTTIKFLDLEARKQATGPYDSKFTGTPYLPPGFEYPKGKTSGNPLFFLAQINFGEFPHLDGFPQKGILQFYINANNDLFGCDFDQETNQAEFRVIFHEEIIEDESQLQTPPDLSEEESNFSTDERKLLAVLKNTIMTTHDFRFHLNMKDELMKEIPELTNEQFYDQIQQINEIENPETHRIGGYPFFTQEDPRLGAEYLKDHTVLLLQVCSDDCIMWGDAGVANFFIKPEDLANNDFSKVAFNWDCC